MNNIIVTLFILLCCLTQHIGNAVEVKILAFSFDDQTQTFYQQFLENEFNSYAQEKGLDITLKMEILKHEQATDSYAFFKSLIESSLRKSKLDIYFYDNKYTSIYGPYLMDLNKVLSKETIEINDPKILEETCTYNGQLVGIPMGMSYEVLFSNRNLLSKYGKTAPKTWEELLEICKDIKEKENNDELICYNGLFEHSEQGLLSLYQFIYSGRDSVDSPYPKPEEKSFSESLKMLKRIKEEVGEKVFTQNENFTFMTLMSAGAIFVKYWFVGDGLLRSLQYDLSILPGLKEGVSGSLVAGSNIGIVKDLEEEKKEAVFEVFRFLTSYDTKKKMFAQGLGKTSVPDLLNDPEICQRTNCELLKQIQFTAEPAYIRDGPDDYRKRYQQYIFEYLYNDKSLEETLKKVDDISKIYTIELSTENSSVGLIYFISFIVVSLLMIGSLAFAKMKNLKQYFTFLPFDMWVITVIGSIIVFSVPFVSYGRTSSGKCYLKILLICLGFTLSVCPTLYKLIVQFPGQGKTVAWVRDNRYVFIVCNVLIDLLLNSFSLITPYSSRTIDVTDGESFEACVFDGNIVLLLALIYKFVVILVFSYFVFVEWNIPSTFYDVRFMISGIYIDVLSFILIYIFNYFEIKNYRVNFLLQTAILCLITLSNYLFFYGIRIFLKFFIKSDPNSDILKNKFSTSEAQSKSNVFRSSVMNKSDNTSNGKKKKKGSNFFTRAIEYHYLGANGSDTTYTTHMTNTTATTTTSNNTSNANSVNVNSPSNAANAV